MPITRETAGILADDLQPRLRAFILRRVRNRDDAEDILQESLYKAFDSLHQFRGDASFRTWVHAIAMNETRQHLRARKRCRTVETPLDPDRIGLFIDRSPTPYDLLCRAEALDHLRQALGALPEQYRQAILSQTAAGEPLVAGAKRLGLSVSALKTRQHRARRMLERQLAR